MTNKESMMNEAVEAIIETLKDGYSSDYVDLHNEVFNTDYYIIGTYQAEKALESYGVFDAIREVREYEDSVFGEYYTDIADPEKLVNMLFYVIGEEVLQGCETFIEYSDLVADDEMNAEIIAELEE